MSSDPWPGRQWAIRPAADDATAHAVAYGSQYLFATASKYFWDETEDTMRADMDALIGRLHDPEWCLMVLREHREWIFSEEPRDNDPGRMQDLWALRRLIGEGTGLQALNVRRAENLQWAAMMGVRDYSRSLLAEGVSQERWADATSGTAPAIGYGVVREAKGRGESSDKEMKRRAERARRLRDPDGGTVVTVTERMPWDAAEDIDVFEDIDEEEPTAETFDEAGPAQPDVPVRRAAVSFETGRIALEWAGMRDAPLRRMLEAVA